MHKPVLSSACRAQMQRISHRPLMLLTYAGLSARLFALMVIDLPEMRNALWLAPLMGAVFSLPVMLCAFYLVRRSRMCLAAQLGSALGTTLSRAIFLLAAGLFAFEAAFLFELLAGSAAYATLRENSHAAALILTAAAVTCIAARGGDAAGGVAAVGLILSPLFYFLVLFSQRSAINPHWLRPLLGPGFSELARGAGLCAFYFCLLPLVMLLDDGRIPTGSHTAKNASPASLLRLFLCCALTVSALCAVHAALYPDLPGLSDSRSVRLDLFLSTGKQGRSVQLPLLILWYASLLVSAVFFLYVGGQLAALALGRTHWLFTAVLGLTAWAVAAASGAGVDPSLRLCAWGALPAAGLWIVSALAACIRARKKARA